MKACKKDFDKLLRDDAKNLGYLNHTDLLGGTLMLSENDQKIKWAVGGEKWTPDNNSIPTK